MKRRDLGDRPHGRYQREGLEERFAVEELPGAVGIVRIAGIGLLGVADAVGHDHGVESGLLGGPGQGQVIRRIGHRFGIREPHGTSRWKEMGYGHRSRLPCGPCPFILPRTPLVTTWSPATAPPSSPEGQATPSTSRWRSSSARPGASSGRWPTPTSPAGPTMNASWRGTRGVGPLAAPSESAGRRGRGRPGHDVAGHARELARGPRAHGRTAPGPRRGGDRHGAGAAAVGALMVLSSLASCSLEDVAAAAPGAPRWMQVYILRDRARTVDLVRARRGTRLWRARAHRRYSGLGPPSQGVAWRRTPAAGCDPAQRGGGSARTVRTTAG